MSVAAAAKAVYEADYRQGMETDHRGRYIAIEPESRRYFLADTFMQAALEAKQEIPGKMSFVIRIGHEAAVHIGAASV